MEKNKLLNKITQTAFFLILLILINGRSLIGVYFFGFRLGELITGFSIVAIFYIYFKHKYFKKELSKELLISLGLLVVFFVLLNIINSADFTDLYIYKTSVFIWYISFLYIGYNIFQNITITKNYFIFGYAGLLIQYIFNVLYYPEFLYNFFLNYSDKVQFLKGSEVSVFFIVVTFFSNKFMKRGYYLDLFLIFTSIYFPLVIFKSRSAGFAIFIYLFFQFYKYRHHYMENYKKTLALLVLSIGLFSFTSHHLIDNIYGIEETDKAIAQVFKHKYVVSNTYDEEVPLIYFNEGRIFSADGNLNWRLQLWQDTIVSSIENSDIIFGLGFNKTIPIFDDLIYAGVDGLNENTHNYILNVYVRGGLVGVSLIFYFFYILSSIPKKGFSKSEYLSFFIPLAFISMFDGSMENPYFACSFYFFVSSLFSGIKFKSNKMENSA